MFTCLCVYVCDCVCNVCMCYIDISILLDISTLRARRLPTKEVYFMELKGMKMLGEKCCLSVV